MKAPYRYSFPAAALAALAATPSGVIAEEPTLESLIIPKSEVETGIAVVGDEAHRFGMYNGMSDGGVFPIFNGSLVNRDETTGTWVRLTGSAVSSDGAEVRFEHEKQGDWNYYIEGGRTTYENPRVINTSITGLGTTQNVLGGATKREVDFDMHRDSLKVGLGKRLGDEYQVNFSAREERKTGMRQWGSMGATAGSAFNFAAEPIEFTTQEYQGNISYTGKQLQLQGGYLGSIFTNDAEVLYGVSTGEQALSLPLNNMMHQLYLNGGYSFTPTTRGTFHVSYSRTIQNEDFFTRPTQAGNTREDLGGEVDNMLVNLGLSSRPLTDLTTRLKLRYEERNDNTELAQYVAASTTRNGFNVPFSRTTATGDAEADYQLPMDFKLTGGVGYEHWTRSSPPVRHTAFRKETDEVSARLSLRRPLLETLSGSVGYAHSERTGSGHQLDGTNLVDPILWANRSRDKGRLTLDWAPIEVLSVQFIGEAAKDAYHGRDLGPQDGSYYFASLDANYKFADDWDLSAWIAWNETSIEQRTKTSAGNPWEARLRHVGKATGLTLRGLVIEDVKLIADLQRSEDEAIHGIKTLGGGAGIGPSLPDIEYRQWLFTLTGDYSLGENQGIKLKYGFAHTTARDWTWKGYTYADGTTVKIPDSEQTHFVGLSFYYRW